VHSKRETILGISTRHFRRAELSEFNSEYTACPILISASSPVWLVLGYIHWAKKLVAAQESNSHKNRSNFQKLVLLLNFQWQVLSFEAGRKKKPAIREVIMRAVFFRPQKKKTFFTWDDKRRNLTAFTETKNIPKTISQKKDIDHGLWGNLTSRERRSAFCPVCRKKVTAGVLRFLGFRFKQLTMRRRAKRILTCWFLFFLVRPCQNSTIDRIRNQLKKRKC